MPYESKTIEMIVIGIVDCKSLLKSMAVYKKTIERSMVWKKIQGM